MNTASIANCALRSERPDETVPGAWHSWADETRWAPVATGRIRKRRF